MEKFPTLNGPFSTWLQNRLFSAYFPQNHPFLRKQKLFLAPATPLFPDPLVLQGRETPFRESWKIKLRKKQHFLEAFRVTIYTITAIGCQDWIRIEKGYLGTGICSVNSNENVSVCCHFYSAFIHYNVNVNVNHVFRGTFTALFVCLLHAWKELRKFPWWLGLSENLKKLCHITNG